MWRLHLFVCMCFCVIVFTRYMSHTLGANRLKVDSNDPSLSLGYSQLLVLIPSTVSVSNKLTSLTSYIIICGGESSLQITPGKVSKNEIGK